MKIIRTANTLKAGKVLKPIKDETWVPIHFDTVPADRGFFISTEGRVAKLHVGPHPYSGTSKAIMLSVGIYDTASGPIVVFKDGPEKRALLKKLFINAFLGKSFMENPFITKKYFSNPATTKINIRALRGTSEAFLYNRYRILDNDYWYANYVGELRVWPVVLGDVTARISRMHIKYIRKEVNFCPTSYDEFIDGTGLFWRPLVARDIAEEENYWISAVGTIVKVYPEINVMSAGIQLGINCKLVPEKKIGGSTAVQLVSVTNRIVNRSPRKLVFNTFVEPEYSGRVGILDSVGCHPTHLLTHAD